MWDVHNVDVFVALFAFFVGAISLNHAASIWRVRNGGILTAVVCMELASFCLWSMIIVLSDVYEVGRGLQGPPITRLLMILDRLTLSLPQAFIVLWVIPNYRRERK